MFRTQRQKIDEIIRHVDNSIDESVNKTSVTQPLPDTPSYSPVPTYQGYHNLAAEGQIAARILQLVKQQLMERKNKKYLLELNKKQSPKGVLLPTPNTTIKWWSLARVAVGDWTGIMYMIPRPFANKLAQKAQTFLARLGLRLADGPSDRTKKTATQQSNGGG